MKRVTELAKQAGISVRTLHHYDAIGLLKPTRVDRSGYRYYDETAVERLYLILLFRELGFPLKEIGTILDAPDYDRNRVLEQQVALLEKKRDRLDYMANMARGIRLVGIKYLEFGGFDVNRIEEYAAQAKTLYGKTDAYKEYAEKTVSYTKDQWQQVNDGLNAVLAKFAERMNNGHTADSDDVQTLVKELQTHITENYYTCTNEILAGLGQMYVADERFKTNIDKHASGTAEFISKAIKTYCN